MRIAQVAPLIEPVPPPFYGGTERVVSYLTEELVRRGHEVTLFASGDSRTRGELRSVLDSSIRLAPNQPDPLAYHVLELSKAFDRPSSFDIIHCHLDYLAFPFGRLGGIPAVHTLHSRLDLPHWSPILSFFPDAPLVSISNDQRRPVSESRPNWIATVYHGFPEEIFRPGPGDGGYIAFISRIAPEKRPDLAIAVAKKAGIPIRLAGKIDATDSAYFEQTIRPLLDESAEYLGEIHESEKRDFLGKAMAFVFPLEWPEPFGMVAVEAMACGTPVITRPYGAMPELVSEGKTGFIAETMEDMSGALRRLNEIDRRGCCEEARIRFSIEKMTSDYEQVYETVLERRKGEKGR